MSTLGYSWGSQGYGEGPYGGDSNVPAADLSLDITTLDHVALGLSRLATQYQASPKLIAYLTAILELSNGVETLLQQMKFLTDIDYATGVNLDVIGKIVGQSRSIGQFVQLVYFGFDTNVYETTFGEDSQLNYGSRFLEDGEDYTGTSVLDDEEYRLLIRGRIIKNASDSTPESLLASLHFLFGTKAVNVDSNGNMTIGVAIGRLLSPIEKVIISSLNILPRPAGVSLSSIVNYTVTSYFGFADQTAAITFNEAGTPSNGAIFAEEIYSA